MRIPVIRGTIDRRILVNYHVDPAVVKRLLPPPFEPQLANGKALVGICLIRLRSVRPRFLPIPWGLGSENAAHRIAVQWKQNGAEREGVFVPRRDTSSFLNTVAGGGLFPGVQHRAAFRVKETSNEFDIEMRSRDGSANVRVSAKIAPSLPNGSVFRSMDEASRFFQRGALGYSVTRSPTRYDGIELCCDKWEVQPLSMSYVESSYFSDQARFPEGSIEFDCALLMRGITHEWRAREDVCCNNIELPFRS